MIPKSKGLLNVGYHQKVGHHQILGFKTKASGIRPGLKNYYYLFFNII